MLTVELGGKNVGKVKMLCDEASPSLKHSFILLFRVSWLKCTSNSKQITDTTAPMCNVVASGDTGDCSDTQSGTTPCDQDHWYIDFNAQDTGMGLYSIKPSETEPGSELKLDAFTAGTTELVGGRYSSSCCYPSVTIVASDVLGNAGRCQVEYDTTPEDNGTPSRVAFLSFDIIMVAISLMLQH